MAPLYYWTRIDICARAQQSLSFSGGPGDEKEKCLIVTLLRLLLNK